MLKRDCATDCGRALCVVIVGVLLLTGCNQDTVNRVDLSGNVIWKGQKVPAGVVTFSPDVRKGNSGPQGVAAIVDGRYDTRSGGGRAPVPGAVNVNVAGFDGLDVNEESPYGNKLFERQTISIDVPTGSDTELDLIVPDTATSVK
jgi:hypothetical protein